jgi:hypothetical protein
LSAGGRRERDATVAAMRSPYSTPAACRHRLRRCVPTMPSSTSASLSDDAAAIDQEPLSSWCPAPWTTRLVQASQRRRGHSAESPAASARRRSVPGCAFVSRPNMNSPSAEFANTRSAWRAVAASSRRASDSRPAHSDGRKLQSNETWTPLATAVCTAAATACSQRGPSASVIPVTCSHAASSSRRDQS